MQLLINRVTKSLIPPPLPYAAAAAAAVAKANIPRAKKGTSTRSHAVSASPPPQFLASRAINNCSCLPFLLCACCFCECLNIEPTADFRFPQKKTARYFFLFFFFRRPSPSSSQAGGGREEERWRIQNGKQILQPTPTSVHIHPYSREERKRTSVAGKRRRGRLVQ